jgi:hypothetical protein
MTRGILERMVKRRPSDEKRRQAADDFLASLAKRLASV